ncbi:ATP-dependent RecD-like DNA helicase [cyanobiont of Ornithocercus magnificus]|nr:ATP-dependent RecD-like DNA helicase [cyanobiont of Ornithocercus magnificus]
MMGRVSNSSSRVANLVTEVLAGSVEHVTFHSSVSGFCVLRIKARGYRDLITVVGYAAEISSGEWVTVSGQWINNREYGLQFKADFLRSSPPTTDEGIEKYLSSGMIHGIGPVYAGKLVEAFGAKVFDVIEQSPERLLEVPGIGQIRASHIAKAWKTQKIVREIMVFLHNHGVGTARSVRIFKMYGSDAIRVMTENPYRLARDIYGIGFRTADAIAVRLGIAFDALIRLRAGVRHALLEASSSGHCGLPKEKLLQLCTELLSVRTSSDSISPLPVKLIEEAMELEINNGTLVFDSLNCNDASNKSLPAIFLAHLYRDEQRIAEALHVLVRGQPPWRLQTQNAINPNQVIPWVEKHLKLDLAKSQQQAIKQALASKALVVTGGPGVGKTTLINAILQILTTHCLRLRLCAPTGRAAKHMQEATGIEARTIHRLLEFDPTNYRFRRGQDFPLDCDLLVVDEVSMVDTRLMACLLTALPEQAALLLVGDVDQLPSIGPGQVLADMIASGVIPVACLDTVFRQAASSRIVTSAHAISAGKLPNLVPPSKGRLTDFYFLEAESAEQALPLIVKLVTERIPQRFQLDPIGQVQVLCPTTRGGCGSRALNIELQQKLNPKPTTVVEHFGSRFALGDKVMQVTNDYDKEVFNGDLGIVDSIDENNSEMTVLFDGRAVVYSWAELDTIMLAYACTIHKSQGSEYPAVVIPLLMQHYTMLQRNLIYTAITRGRQLVVLVGQKKALAIAVKNQLACKRWTKLKDWLQTLDK